MVSETQRGSAGFQDGDLGWVSRSILALTICRHLQRFLWRFTGIAFGWADNEGCARRLTVCPWCYLSQQRSECPFLVREIGWLDKLQSWAWKRCHTNHVLSRPHLYAFLFGINRDTGRARSHKGNKANLAFDFHFQFDFIRV